LINKAGRGGFPFSEGDDWKRRRKVLAETLLLTQNAKEYVPVVVPCANRLVDALQASIQKDHRLDKAHDIKKWMGLFAFEAVMKVVVGVDFPALAMPPPRDAVGFLQAVERMFDKTTTVENLPFLMKINAKPFRQLKAYWNEMYRYTSETLQPALEYYQQHGKLPEDCNGTVLPKLIEEHEAGNLSLEEVKLTGTVAISAAVDTTAQTFEYLLYNLGRNPDVQEKIRQEVVAICGDAAKTPTMELTIAQYEQLKYLAASVRESMRLTPTIGVHARTQNQSLDLGDFTVEEGDLVLINYLEMSHDPSIYPEPHLFLPERFLKGGAEPTVAGCPLHQEKETAIQNNKAKVNVPQAAIPFGHGGRKCIGKGFAELDLHLALAALLRHFRIEYDGPDVVQVEKTLLRPKEPIIPHFKFIPLA